MTLPSGWVEATVGDVVQLRNAKALPSNLGQAPFIGLEHIEPHSGRLLAHGFASDVKSAVATFKPGDILYSRLRPYLNKVFQPDFVGCASAELIVLTPTPGIEAGFLRRVIMSPHFLAYTASLDQGDRPRVGPEDVRAYRLKLPPLAEQRRIVKKLDALTARITRARAELERAIKLAQILRGKTLENIFERFSGAPIVRVDEICRVGTGSTPKRGEPRYYKGGNIPWVTSGVVNERLVLSPTELITERAVKETNCKVFPLGSLLVALYGEGKTRGKVTELGISAATNQALAALYDFDRSRVEPEWIRLFLVSRYEETRGEAAGGVQPNLNLGIVKSIEIPLPDLDEQRGAIQFTKAAFARADRLEAEAARAKTLLDRLESAILAKAFKGELVPQDPTDEPASVLLERICTQRAAAPKPARGRRRGS